MRNGTFNGIEICLSSRLDGYPTIRMKGNGEEYKPPFYETAQGEIEIFCETRDHIEFLRDSLFFAARELDKQLKD